MTISPTFRTTKPLADIVSVSAERDRLIVLDIRTPLSSNDVEQKHLINAGTRVVQRGGFLAFHASRDSLRGTTRFIRTLADQTWKVSSAVAGARGNHENQVRVYHRPQLFLPELERGLGWDIVVVGRTRQRRADAVHGVLVQRYIYNDVLDGVLRSVTIPETEPVHAVYMKMYRSITSVATKRFPHAKSWKTTDEIEEIDLNESP